MEEIVTTITTLGHSVIVPVILFCIALLMRVEAKTALRSAILVGVALTAFGWLIGVFTPLVTKVIQSMVHLTGFDLPITDTGWQTAPLTGFRSSIGVLIFVTAPIIEGLLFFAGITRVLFLTNLWQNWGFMIWGTLCLYKTNNFLLSYIFAIFLLLVTLLISEVQADRYADYYQVKNGTIADLQNVENAIPAMLFDPIWNKLKLNKVQITEKNLRNKLGAFADPMMIGAVLGFALALLANLNKLHTAAGWSNILNFSMQLAAVMTIFPMIAGLFGKAFRPLTKEISKKYQQKNKKRWFIAVDDGLGYGEKVTLMAGVTLIPVMLLIAFLLPGNRMIPVVDLIALPFMLQSIVAIHHGNLAKIFATAVVWFSLGLYAGSSLAPLYSHTVSHYGTAVAAGATLIISYNVIARPLTALLFAAWTANSILLIAIVVFCYVSLLIFFRRNREAVWHYLRQNAYKNQQFSE